MMADTLRDPVCGMSVTYDNAQARSEYNGQTYYFCSMDCKEQFDRDPERYVKQEQQAHR
jgi:YHS domain-containing protein